MSSLREDEKTLETPETREVPEEEVKLPDAILALLDQMKRTQERSVKETIERNRRFEENMKRMEEEKVKEVSEVKALDITSSHQLDEEDITDEMIRQTPLIYLQDSELSVRLRLKAVEYAKDIDALEETVESLLGLYQNAPVKSLETILYEIGVKSKLTSVMKFRIGQALTNHTNDVTLACDIFSRIVDTDLNSNQRFQMILYLLTSPNIFHFKYGRQRLHEYLTSSKITSETRYRALLTPSIPYEIKIESLVQFASNKSNDVYYRILACQAFCKHLVRPVPKGYGKFETDILGYLLSIAKDTNLSYNRRADAADIALSEFSSKEALEIIKDLGGRKKDLFENKQNVHFVDTSNILKSIVRDLPEDRNEFEKEYDSIVTEIKALDSRTEVLAALHRIELDFSTIGATGIDKRFLSKEILWMVWKYIESLSDEYKRLGRVRLLEELYEAADTCPSGHSVRLLNSLSSIGGLTTSISWKNQVISNFKGRMMALIRTQPPDIRGDLMSELIDEDDRPKLKAFIIKNLGPLVDELRKEFVGEGHISGDDFDGYIQDSIMFFEGYHC